MWFLPRQTPLITLLLVLGVVVTLVMDLKVVAYALSGSAAAILLLATVFDLWKPPEE
jgi:uncharacterized membrane protein YccC